MHESQLHNYEYHNGNNKTRTENTKLARTFDIEIKLVARTEYSDFSTDHTSCF